MTLKERKKKLAGEIATLRAEAQQMAEDLGKVQRNIVQKEGALALVEDMLKEEAAAPKEASESE